VNGELFSPARIEQLKSSPIFEEGEEPDYLVALFVGEDQYQAHTDSPAFLRPQAKLLDMIEPFEVDECVANLPGRCSLRKGDKVSLVTVPLTVTQGDAEMIVGDEVAFDDEEEPEFYDDEGIALRPIPDDALITLNHIIALDSVKCRAECPEDVVMGCLLHRTALLLRNGFIPSKKPLN